MPRKKLAKLGLDERRPFEARFSRLGTKPGYRGVDETLLLVNVIDLTTGSIVTDHLWFNYTKGFKNLGRLEPGAKIRFSGRVKEYRKGYIDKAFRDWKIDRPTKVELVTSSSRVDATNYKPRIRSQR